VKVLVTGFEPFGGDRINSSLEVVRNLPCAVGSAPGGADGGVPLASRSRFCYR
jgi:hypothetical protein